MQNTNFGTPAGVYCSELGGKLETDMCFATLSQLRQRLSQHVHLRPRDLLHGHRLKYFLEQLFARSANFVRFLNNMRPAMELGPVLETITAGDNKLLGAKKKKRTERKGEIQARSLAKSPEKNEYPVDMFGSATAW